MGPRMHRTESITGIFRPYVIVLFLLTCCAACGTIPDLSAHKKGCAQLKAHDYKGAIESFNQAVSLNPKYALAYLGRGRSYQELGQPRKSIEDFSQAIELDPKLTLAYVSRGIAYGKLGLHQKAVDNYSKALELDSKQSLAYGYRALAYRDLGKNELAVRDLLRLKSLRHSRK